jgi:hypothetical protein
MYRCTDIMFFQNPQYRASRQLLIPRIAGVGTSFSPLPCQAWHGYRVTSAHRVEVEVSADGPASAPLSGAAAAAPPAGAESRVHVLYNNIQSQSKYGSKVTVNLKPTYIGRCKWLARHVVVHVRQTSMHVDHRSRL